MAGDSARSCGDSSHSPGALSVTCYRAGMITRNQTLSAVGLSLMGLWLAGCASPPRASEGEGGEATYRTVYSTGSRIPQRVRQGEAAADDSGASPVAVMSGSQAQSAARQMGTGAARGASSSD